MAQPTVELILALRTTAARLAGGARFQWTHMGACICGNLVQTITEVDPAELHEIALQRAGDWGQQAYDYCPSSGLPIDHVFARLTEIGLQAQDIGHLERLNHPRVLEALGGRRQVLNHRDRNDVVRYLETWAILLEGDLPTGAIAAMHSKLPIAA
ncbi:MAG: hypothetical protein ACI81R_001563 [Bradymonadia bacterium]|jgi:hypothetical protein